MTDKADTEDNAVDFKAVSQWGYIYPMSNRSYVFGSTTQLPLDTEED